VTKFSDLDTSGPVFYYDPPTNVSFGAGPPNVRDPYEVKWVEVVRIMFTWDRAFKTLYRHYYFPSVSHIYPFLIFAGKVRILTSEWSPTRALKISQRCHSIQTTFFSRKILQFWDQVRVSFCSVMLLKTALSQ
jgi:hypothetical protein